MSHTAVTHYCHRFLDTYEYQHFLFETKLGVVTAAKKQTLYYRDPYQKNTIREGVQQGRASLCATSNLGAFWCFDLQSRDVLRVNFCLFCLPLVIFLRTSDSECCRQSEPVVVAVADGAGARNHKEILEEVSSATESLNACKAQASCINSRDDKISSAHSRRFPPDVAGP